MSMTKRTARKAFDPVGDSWLYIAQLRTDLFQDTFPLSQIYVIIILPDGGPDLESLRVENATKTGWRQAYSIFWQVANALGQAEQKLSFEVRARMRAIE
jgi:hypothetical protein